MARVLNFKPIGARAALNLVIVTPVLLLAFAYDLSPASFQGPLLFFFVLSIPSILVFRLPQVTTRIRFTVEGDRLRIEWRRFGRALRHTEVRLAELRDVALERSTIPRRKAYRVVLGMASFDLPMTPTFLASLPDQERGRAELAAFLGVPERTMAQAASVGGA
jgi:hypothetical protein